MKVMKPRDRGRCEGCWFFERMESKCEGTGYFPVSHCRYLGRGYISENELYKNCSVDEISVTERVHE